eukprot:1164842-Rhodomonas_salina.1
MAWSCTSLLCAVLLLQLPMVATFYSLPSRLDIATKGRLPVGVCRAARLFRRDAAGGGIAPRMTGTHASRYFREDSGPDFPKSMEEVLHQVGGSINAAIDDGFHHRMRVQINCKEFDLRTTPYSKSLVPYFINLVGNQLVDRGLRVSFVFNSVSDASEARRLLRDNLKDRAAINVLGLGDFSAEFDIMVLVCPSNEGNENLRRIEAVEKVIYGGPPRSMVSRTGATDLVCIVVEQG